MPAGLSYHDDEPRGGAPWHAAPSKPLLTRQDEEIVMGRPIHVIVAIKQVPDTSNVRINPETGTLIREGVPAIINPYEAHALELAVLLKNKHGGRITVLTMGPAGATEALKECIEQGADRAILISDRKFAAADTLATSYVIATAIAAIHAETPADLLLFGKQAIDGDTAQVGPGVATRLNLPLITCATAIEAFDPDNSQAIIHRKIERGTEVLQTPLPALLTVEKEIAPISRAPLPNIIRAAKYKPEMWSASEPVAFDVTQIGIKGSPTIVGNAHTPPVKKAGPAVSAADKGVEQAIAEAMSAIDKAGVIKGVAA
jgi:electron transfer flavoprotein beta subunit